MSISFDEIPVDIRTFGQYLEINNERAVQGTPAQPHVALVIGQGLATGTIVEVTPTLVPSGDAAETYWGVGSMMAEMCRAFKKANPTTQLWGISLDDAGGGVKRIMTATFGGTATEAAEVALYIGGRRVAISVASGDAAADISVAMDVAILADSQYARMPFVATQATVVNTFTARNAGVPANGEDIRHSYQPTEHLPAGVTLAIAQTTPGSSDATLGDALAAMGDVQYHTIVIPYTDATGLTAIEAEMLTRWGPMEQKEGHVFASAVGSQSTLTTLGNGRNSQFLTIVESGGSSGNSPTPVYLVAAIAGAVNAKQVEIDPARPRQTLVMTGMLPPKEDDRFTRTERNTLLTDGIATTYVDAGGLVRVERFITTYQTNPLSIPDPSYLDVTTLNTLSRLRFDVRSRIALKFPRHKLADDGTQFDPGQAVVTPSSIRAELISLFRLWERQGLVENFDQFKDELIVERNATDVNRIDMRMSPNLMNQFRVFAGQLQFLL